MKLALQCASLILILLCGCHGESVQLNDRAEAALMFCTVETTNCKLELRADMHGSKSLKRGECLFTLKNVGVSPIDLPDFDIGKHLAIFVRLVDMRGQEAALTPLGSDQFHNLAATFIQSRTLHPGDCIIWTLDFNKTFVISSKQSYVVHAIYACHNTGSLPDIELAGMQFNPWQE